MKSKKDKVNYLINSHIVDDEFEFRVKSEDFNEFFRYCLAIICFLLTLIVFGCAGKCEPKIEYREVKVPVKCSIEIPIRPLGSSNPVITNLDILQYANELEAALKRCSNDK